MGAAFTEQIGTGKTAAEAFAKAVSDAAAEYGHQEGYSGAINSGGYGFSLITMPPRFTYTKLQRLIEDYDDAKNGVYYARESVKNFSPGGFHHGRRGWKGNLRKAQTELRKAERTMAKIEKQIPAALAYKFDGLVEAYQDKWGDYLAVELRGSEAKRYGSYATKRRGEKLFVFFGYAPC